MHAVPQPGSAPRPAPSDLVLLADTGFVLPPDFYLGAGGQAPAGLRHQLGEFFLKSSMTPSSWAWWRGRAVIFVKPIAFNSRLTVVSSSEIANISRIQPARSFSRQRTTPSTAGFGPASTRAPSAWRCASSSFAWDPARQILQPPAHHAVDRRVRPRIDACPQRLALCIVELRHRTGRLAIDQAVRALGVEMQHPISDHLKPHVAGPCRIRPPPTVIDHRESQEPAALAGILGKLRQATQLRRIETLSYPDRRSHGEPPQLRITGIESEIIHHGNPQSESPSRPIGIKGHHVPGQLQDIFHSRPGWWTAKFTSSHTRGRPVRRQYSSILQQDSAALEILSQVTEHTALSSRAQSRLQRFREIGSEL